MGQFDNIILTYLPADKEQVWLQIIKPLHTYAKAIGFLKNPVALLRVCNGFFVFLIVVFTTE